MRYTRFPALFLALLTVILCLFGCGTAPGGPADSAPPATTAPGGTPDTSAPEEDPLPYTLMTVADDGLIESLWAKTRAKIDAIMQATNELKPAEGGTVYYVSAKNGNDKADGLTPETAWQTLSRVIVKSRKTIKAGDVVAFERGGIYRATDVAFETVSGVTYTAFGQGEKPIITSSLGDTADPAFWSQTEENPNVWKCSRNVSFFGVGNIVFNGGESQGTPVYLEYYDESLDGATGNVLTGLPFESYEDLTEDGQFRYVRDEVRNADILYLYCSAGNPGEVYDSIEFCREINAISCSERENVVLENLSVRYSGRHGIVLNNAKNITVRNCEVAYIGGSVMPYTEDDYRRWEDTLGNGIEVYGSVDGFFVENCYIHHVVDEAITTQHTGAPMLNLHYTDNVITHCRQAVSLWGATEANVLEFSRNDCWYTGYGLPTEHRIRFGEDGGVIELDTKNLDLELRLEDNLIAFATVVMVQLDACRDTFSFSGNTYIGEDTAYLTVGGVTYHWDDSGAKALQNTAGDRDATLYVYITEDDAPSRVQPSMTLPADVKAGDAVTFGVYEQDGNVLSGAEAIEWIVLEVRDGKALLLSKHVLECLWFHPRETALNWKSSGVREFLDGDFTSRAFTREEAAKIVPTEVGMGGSVHAGDGEKEGASSGVFILSIEELRAYLGEDGLKAAPTAYAEALSGSMKNLPVKDGGASYWVRNFGKRTKFAGFVSWNGEYDEYGAAWNTYANRGLRPAMWVQVG